MATYKKVWPIVTVVIVLLGVAVIGGLIGMNALTHQQAFQVISSYSPTPIPSITPSEYEYNGKYVSLSYPSTLTRDTKDYSDTKNAAILESLLLRSSVIHVDVAAQVLAASGVSTIAEASSVAFRMLHRERYSSNAVELPGAHWIAFYSNADEQGNFEASMFLLRNGRVISIVVTSPSKELSNNILQQIIPTIHLL